MTRKQDNIALADARDSVLMDFNIPEDNAAAVSVPPQPVTAVVEPQVYPSTAESDLSLPPAPIAETDESLDEVEEPIEYMKLDAEIECLQLELNRMKHEPNNVVVENDITVEKSNGACHSEPEPAQPLVKKKSSSSCSPIKALMVSMGVVMFGLFLCVVLTVVVMEVKWDKFEMVQNHQAVKELRLQYYDPVRGYLMDSWAKLTKK